MDTVLTCIVTITIPCPFIIYFSSLILKFDPVYYIFADILEYLYPQKHNVPNSLKLLAILCRAIATTSVFPCGRILAAGTMLNLLLADLVHLILKEMKLLANQAQQSGLNRCIRLYRYLSLTYVLLRDIMEHIFRVAVPVAFWGLVFACWIVMKAYAAFSVYMYGMITFATLVSLLAFALFLTVSSQISECCCEITERLKWKAKYWYGQGKTEKLRKLGQRQIVETRALQPVQLQYKPFRNIDASFRTWVAENLADRMFDAILIF